MSSLVSIIIPCYNAERWIADAIESCLAQTYHPIEIIVVDDGSTDGSAETAKSCLMQGHIPYQIIHIENSGPSRARNIGWQYAQGEWVQFLDADDLLTPDKINLQMQRVLTDSPDTAVLFSKWQYLTQHNNQGWQASGYIHQPSLSEPIPDLLRSDAFLAMGSYIVQRCWLKCVAGFDESMWLIEDVNLLLRIAHTGGKFIFVDTPHPIFFYRQQSTSLSHSNQAKFIEACFHNTQLVNQWLVQRGQMSEEERKVLLEAYNFIARFSYEVNRETFYPAYNALKQLSGGHYIPDQPKHLRLVAMLLGYPQAELVASLYRKIKRVLRFNG